MQTEMAIGKIARGERANAGNRIRLFLGKKRHAAVHRDGVTEAQRATFFAVRGTERRDGAT